MLNNPHSLNCVRMQTHLSNHLGSGSYCLAICDTQYVVVIVLVKSLWLVPTLIVLLVVGWLATTTGLLSPIKSHGTKEEVVALWVFDVALLL